MRIDLRWGARLEPEIAQVADAVADRVKPQYARFIEDLTPSSAPMEWWVSELASRNPRASRLYEHFWKLALVKELITTEQPVTEVIVETKSFRTVLEQWLETSGRRGQIRVTGGHRRDLGILLGSLARIVLHWARLAPRMLTGRRGRGRRVLEEEAPITLLDVFAGPGDIRGRRFVDRFYGNLLDLLQPAERDRIFYLPRYYGSRWIPSLIRALERTEANFLFPEDHLRARDYLFAYSFGLRFLGLKLCCPPFDDFEVGPLLRTECLLVARSGNSAEGLVRVRLARRLRASGIRVRLVINWFENQAIDRGLNRGFREAYPDIPVWGYQGMYASKEYLSLFPTSIERENRVIPEKVFVIGRELVEPLKRFCPEVTVAIAPAFRFSHLWDEVPRRGTGPGTVLVALPIHADMGRAMIEWLLEAIDMVDLPYIKYWLKVHPATPRRALGRIPPPLEVATRSFAELLPESSVVVTSASSTAMEALLSGKHVVVTGNPFGPTEQTIPSSVPSDAYSVVHSSGALATALASYWKVDRGISADRGIALRSAYCEPVTRDGIERLLDLAPSSPDRSPAVGRAPVNRPVNTTDRTNGYGQGSHMP